MELVEQKSCDDTHYIANGPQAGIQPPTLHVVTKLKTASLSPTLSPGRHRRLGAVVDQVVDELFGEKVRFLIWPGIVGNQLVFVYLLYLPSQISQAKTSLDLEEY